MPDLLPEEQQPLTDEDEDFESGSGSDGAQARRAARWRSLCCASLAAVGIAVAVWHWTRPPGAAGVNVDGLQGLQGQQCDGAGRTGAPVDNLHVHYLMMTVDKVPHASIWAEFFAGGAPGSYSAWMHCKEPQKCEADMAAANFTAFTVVPAVYNAWCEDLVSPMVQLLKVALAERVSPPGVQEKFVFLSDKTLPLKPLRAIQAELGKHPDASDFCFYPTGSWFPSENYSNAMIPPASQWSILSRVDAEAVVENFPPPTEDHPILVPDMSNMSYYNFTSLNCIDEGAIFWSIFGAFYPGRASNTYPGVGPLRASDDYSQGCCRTFGFMSGHRTDELDRHFLERWAKHTTFAHAMVGLMDIPDSEVLTPHTHCDTICEIIYVINRLGPQGLEFLRQSPFLFARKFPDNASLPGYAEAMFA